MSKSKLIADLATDTDNTGAVLLKRLSKAVLSNITDMANKSKGYLSIPVGTTKERPTNPKIGYLRFNSNLLLLEFYRNDNKWVAIARHG